MSVSPDDPLNLPAFRRPSELQGTGRDPLWTIRDTDLNSELCYRPDPMSSQHGFIEPSRTMTLEQYAIAVKQTQPLWQKVTRLISFGDDSNGD